MPRAEAHPDLQNAMWIQFEPAGIRLAVDVSMKELSAVWGIPDTLPPQDNTKPLLWAAEKHQSYLLEHLSIFENELKLAGQVLKVSPPSEVGDPEKTFVQYEIQYSLPRTPAREIRVYHEMLKEWPYAPGTPWNIRYIVRTKRSDSGAVSSWLLSYGEPLELDTGWGEPPSKPQTEPEQSGEPPLLKKIWRAMQRFLGL